MVIRCNQPVVGSIPIASFLIKGSIPKKYEYN
ncbi:hypothetical protein CBUD_1888a [Coxiella burnetii Dugway 5J108-111]|uniref:Uncharacterized protein n=1 Tax=Coxiella burnetii (strain Dugway 5J108-111) TaxID=434922 RepID=B5XHJ2_COXBN|nr:hypothetical protein CBUD_1888a [Coxiella burnetii Dugway 5J108-111]